MEQDVDAMSLIPFPTSYCTEFSTIYISLSLSSYLSLSLSLFLSFCLSFSPSVSLSLSLSHTHSHSHSHSLTHSLTHSHSLTQSHSLTHPLPHSLTHSITNSLYPGQCRAFTAALIGSWQPSATVMSRSIDRQTYIPCPHTVDQSSLAKSSPSPLISAQLDTRRKCAWRPRASS